ncbi:MAG: hypothetical protein HY537_00655 [Deltaproteobacteria bacterium]|nr:hypothetical protein [Deltaproteobacteria bacterium]
MTCQLFITPSGIGYCGIVFFSLVLAQILFWQIAYRLYGGVRRQIIAVFVIYIGIPLLLFIFSRELAGTLMILSLSCAYIMSFPAAAAWSPSFEVLMFVKRKQKRQGVTKETVLKELALDRLVWDRVRDLTYDGFITGETEFSLKPSGRRLAALFHWYRTVLRLQQKGS